MKMNPLLLSTCALSMVCLPLAADSLPDRESVRSGERLTPTKVNETTEDPTAPAATSESAYPDTTRSVPPQARVSLLTLLNRGSEADLMEINGIAESKARVIIRSRPIFELDELFLLRGFGPRTVSKVLAHGEKATR